MAPTMPSRIAIREIGFTLTLLLVSSAQAVNYEVHMHDAIPNRNNVILTTRDFLDQLNFVVPKASYTLQEATEYLLQFGALLRARVLDTFGKPLYVYYDDFSIAEVEALRKVYREILERRYDIFNLVPSVLRNQDTRPSRICTEIYEDHTVESCLRNSASVCSRIRKQHDLPHPDDRSTPALNVTYRIYRLSKISKYSRGFFLTTILRFLQQEMLTITPKLLSGLLYNVKYDNYDDDVRLAERELVKHFHEIMEISEVPTKKLRKFYTMNSFLKYYIDIYAEKILDNDLKKHAIFIARRIADNVGTIDENIHLLGNVYENQTIHVGYLFDLVLPDDLLENDVIKAKKHLVAKLNKFKVVERYLRVQKYQQITPAQLTMEVTGQLRDIDFDKSIATSLRMHAKFWHRSLMIKNLDELLELFDTYENLRQMPRYLRMMKKIDTIKESLRDMKDIPIEILCNVPRTCLRIGLQLILRCKFINSQIKDPIKDFLELSDKCIDPMYIIQESRRSAEIPFKISKVRYTTALQTTGKFISEATTRRSTIEDRSESIESTESVERSDETTEKVPTEFSEESSEITSMMTTPWTTIESVKPTSTTPVATTITMSPTTTTTLSSTTLSMTTTMLPITTTSPTTTTTMLPTTTSTDVTTSTELPTTTITSLTTASTTSPTTISTTLPTTTTASSTVTTELSTIDMKMKLERSKVRTVKIPYSDDTTKPSKITPALTRSCESNECEQTSERVETITTPFSPTTTQTSTHEIIRSSESSMTYQDFIRKTTASSTALSERPVTKGDDCAKTCLESCKSKGESFETSGRSYDMSCDSVTEDCDGKDSVSKDSPECGMENDRNCDCAIKQEKSAECMTLCLSESVESCEGAQSDCTTSVPTNGMKLERTRARSICEIWDPHYRRQLKRLAKMRAISAVSSSVATSRVDVVKPTTSHRDRITSKKMYDQIVELNRLPYFKNKRLAEYLKRPVGTSDKLNGDDKDWSKQWKQVYKQARRQLGKKFSGKLTQGTTIVSRHHTRGVTPFRHSQIKRISGRDEKTISA